MSSLPASLPLLLLAALSSGCSDSSAAPPAQAPASAPVAVPASPTIPADTALQSENAELRTRLSTLTERVTALQGELADERAARVQREQDWLQFQRGMGELSRGTGVQLPEFRSTQAKDEPPAPAAAPDPALAERAAHGRKLVTKLRALFASDEIAGLDLLEAGDYQDGALGPVVLRMLDVDGRPYGTLCAERLRLEASVSARTLTLVLEQGYERRGEQRFPFADPGLPAPPPIDQAAGSDDRTARHGARRIALPEIDPRPWIASLPELFGASAKSALKDDGKHDLTAIRVALNQLLREDAAGGWWRLAGLEGVQQDVLREVVLDGFDREGHQERRLFADRLTVLEQSRGVELLLEGGAQLRGDQKVPFLEDRYRIFLPQADATAWAKAGVPVVRTSAPAAAAPKQD